MGLVVTIAAGYFDINREMLAETDRYVDFHMVIGWTLFCSVWGMTFWRWRIFQREDILVDRQYLAAALLIVGITLNE